MSGTITRPSVGEPPRLAFPSPQARPVAGVETVPPAALATRSETTPESLPANDRLDVVSAHGAIPATGAGVATASPAPGSALRLGPGNGLGKALSSLVRDSDRLPGERPQTSNWSDANDLRLTLPVAQETHGAVSTSLETLPGRDEQWMTIRVAQKPADSRFNGDGLQGAVRVGIGGPWAGPSPTVAMGQRLGPDPTFEWAELRAGIEGLVVTGQIVDGAFRVSRLELEEGFFKSQLNGVGEWAGENLALAIPLGLAAGGAAVYAVSQAAEKTGQDIAVPLTAKVFERNGFSLHPTLRPVFGASEFMRFGGADLGVGYQIPGKLDLMVRPGWNLDATNGATGPRVSARATMPIHLPGAIQGAAGVAGSYDPQRGPTVTAGLSIRF